MKNIKSLIAGTLAVFIWAVIPCLVKGGVENTSISFFLFLRFAIASIILIYWIPGVLKRFTKVNLLLWVSLLTDLGANYYFQTIAMKSFPVSWYIVIFSLNPILSLFLLRIRFTKTLIAAILISLFGTALFDTQQMEPLSVSFSEVASLIIGMLTWVFYTFLIKKFQIIYNDLEVTTLTNVTSLAAITLIWSFSGFSYETPSAATISAASILGIGTVLAFAFYSFAMRRTPVFGVMCQYLEPIFGVAAAYFVFHESLSFIQILGAALIIVAMSRVSISES